MQAGDHVLLTKCDLAQGVGTGRLDLRHLQLERPCEALPQQPVARIPVTQAAMGPCHHAHADQLETVIAGPFRAGQRCVQLDADPRTGVALVPPGAADAGRGFDHLRLAIRHRRLGGRPPSSISNSTDGPGHPKGHGTKAFERIDPRLPPAAHA